jgi:hypothetical protein
MYVMLKFIDLFYIWMYHRQLYISGNKFNLNLNCYRLQPLGDGGWGQHVEITVSQHMCAVKLNSSGKTARCNEHNENCNDWI